MELAGRRSEVVLPARLSALLTSRWISLHEFEARSFAARFSLFCLDLFMHPRPPPPPPTPPAPSVDLFRLVALTAITDHAFRGTAGRAFC